MPFLPSLQTQVEDEDAEREEEEDVDDGEGEEAEKAGSVVKAVGWFERGVRREEVRRKEGGVRGGRGVERHNSMRREMRRREDNRQNRDKMC